MNPLKQYTDLYQEHRELIDSGAGDAMNRLRGQACAALERAELPRKGSEDYEHTDLAAILAPDYGINLGRIDAGISPAEAFSCKVPSMSTALFMLLGDRFGATQLSHRQLPEGVVVSSLAAACRSHREVMERYYGSVASLSNPLVALNTMLAQDGMLLYVPAGVKVAKPLQLISLLHGSVDMMAVRRLLIVLEEGAEATLLCCDHTQSPDHGMLALQTVEIIAGAGSRFEYYELEESTRNTRRLSSLYVHQHRDSQVLIDGITLYNGTTRNEYFCTLSEPGASLRLLGMGIEDDDRRLDNHSLIVHEAPRCHSDELMKYVVDDSAIGAFSGRIYVAHGAEKTEAYQANRNMVCAEGARMYSKPQLEIYNDDVKCSHGTAIGQMDEKQLFYMQQRGISLPVAHTLLKQAFMADVIEGVHLSPLRDRLRMLVDMRFASDGANHDCSACAIKNSDNA